jgi:hypothetical protein
VKNLVVLTWVLACAWFAEQAHADNGDTYVRLQYGKSSESNFETAVLGDFEASKESNYMLGGSWGKQLNDHVLGLPLVSTANIGFQWFNERGLQDDGYGVTGYYKLHYQWRLPWTQTHVRLGLGEGLSYVTRIPLNEVRDFAMKRSESEKLLNHLEWTVDLPLRQFAPLASMFNGPIKEVNVGFVVWHRSSIYGLLAKTGGGANFMGFAIEAQY